MELSLVSISDSPKKCTNLVMFLFGMSVNHGLFIVCTFKHISLGKVFMILVTLEILRQFYLLKFYFRFVIWKVCQIFIVNKRIVEGMVFWQFMGKM